MKKLLCSANLLVILALVLAGIFISGAANSESQNGDAYTYDPNAPKIQTRRIAVEAYLAQIPDEALIEIGLPLMPTKESETITVDKLLKCLDSTKTKGKIITSGRWVTIGDNKNCSIEQINTLWFPVKVAAGPNDTPIGRVDCSKYDIGTAGSIKPWLIGNNKICVDINFSYYDLLENNKENINNEIPHDNFRYRLDETCVLDNNVPAIIGAVKQGNSVLYLVVRAKVLDE